MDLFFTTHYEIISESIYDYFFDKINYLSSSIIYMK